VRARLVAPDILRGEHRRGDDADLVDARDLERVGARPILGQGDAPRLLPGEVRVAGLHARTAHAQEIAAALDVESLAVVRAGGVAQGRVERLEVGQPLERRVAAERVVARVGVEAGRGHQVVRRRGSGAGDEHQQGGCADE
jgi:hypothetical protein